MRSAVFHQAVSDVVDLQQLLVVLLLHRRVDRPGHHLHAPLGPVLHIVSVEVEGRGGPQQPMSE